MSLPDPDAVLDLLRAHRTVRRFAPEPLDDVLLARCVEAAQCAATSSHVQGYALVRVRDAGERAALAELCGGQRQVAEAGAFLVVCGDARRHQLVAARAGEPCAHNLEAFLVTAIDASLFAQNLVVALEAHGLGTCYIGGLRSRLDEVVRLLELPGGVYPLYGLCVGRPAEVADDDPARPVQRPRLPLAAVLAESRYPADADVLAAVDAHDAAMGAHYAERGKPGHTWSGGVARRNSRPMRQDLASVYRSLGADLD